MEELTIKNLQGLWIGKEYNLIVGLFKDPNYCSLIDKLKKSTTETRTLELSEITEGNTRMLILNKEISIEIWSWNKPEMTIKINDAPFDLILRE